MQSNVEAVQQLYAAFRRRDLPTILAIIAPEVEITQSPELPWGGRYQGHAGLETFFTTLLQHVDSEVEVERLIGAGDHVVAIGRTHGKVRATGTAFSVPVAHVWEFQAGQAIRFSPYIDNAMMLTALRP